MQKKRTKSEVESTSGNGMSRKKKLEAYFVNLIDIQKMFQFKIHKYLRIDPGGGQISPPSWRPCVLAWDKGGKLLLMMKTKGCEEKWDFVKSLCKNLIKRTTWHSREAGEKKKEEPWNAEKIQIVNFLLFSSLHEKRDFYSNSSPFLHRQALLQTAEDFKMEKLNRAWNIQMTFWLFSKLFCWLRN